MPMHKGHSREVIAKNIKEMVAAGHDPKQAIAASLATARKYKKMAEGGMVDFDDDMDDGTNNSEDAQRSLAELQAQGRSLPQEIENPRLEEHSDMLAKALFDKSQEHDAMPYADGGLVVDVDGKNGNEPSMDMVSDTDEPMDVMPVKPAPPEHTMSGLSEMAKQALMAKKRKRMFS